MINLKQLVLDATNNGLDIILALYPQARDSVDNPKLKFRIRNENTPSCTLRQTDGGWYVHDFGTGENLSAFDCFMKEHNIGFSDALYRLAENYGVDYSLKKEINKPTIEEAPSAEKFADWLTWDEKPTTRDELSVFVPFLRYSNDEDGGQRAFDKYLAIFRQYGWRSLQSYTCHTRGRRIKYTQNENYPMFLRHCGDWQKVYLPYEYNKSGRFFSHGTKPRDYINGLSELESAFRAFLDEQKKSETKADNPRLPSAIICSGERDAMCVAMMGYYPLWLNSETATLSEKMLAYIYTMVERVYNIPDIDATGVTMGRRLALAHLSIYTVALPKSLLERKDNRGRPRKDLHDYLELYPNATQFALLLDSAETAKFWTTTKNKTTISYAGLLHFLKLNGFFKWIDPISQRSVFVRLQDNKRVCKVYDRDIDRFVKDEIIRRSLNAAVKEAYFLAKKKFSRIFEELETIDLDFTHYGKDYRIFDFRNCSVRVSGRGVKVLDGAELATYTWEDKVIPFDFAPIQPSFSIGENGDIDIAITDSFLQRFVINASRIYWREELENRCTGNAAVDASYREAFRFSIMGDRLTDEEQRAQKELYFNKLYFIGNMLHRYKSKSHSYGYWLMENNIIMDGVSSGGSGKSFLIDSFRALHLLSVINLDGRDRKVFDNLFFLERVDSETDLVNVDDIAREANFFTFYNKISGDTIINPKQQRSFELKFEQSPNYTFTSNFAQPSADPSTMRRIINVPFSDYYHHKTATNEYNETRTIRDDLGIEMFGPEYTERNYIDDINFCFDCLSFFLLMRERDVVCRPPMQNIIKRIELQQMGQQFLDFCDFYFLMAKNTDKLLVRNDVYEEYRRFVGTNSNSKSSTAFRSALISYCLYKDFTYCPKDLDCYYPSTKRLIKVCHWRGVRMSYEMIYIQTAGTPLNNELPSQYVMP